MSPYFIQIIILGAIAVALVLFLLNTLGKRTGFEPDENNVIPLDPARRAKPVLVDDDDDVEIEDYAHGNAAIADALRKAKAREPEFHVGEFLRGARMAYEWILQSYYDGDLSETSAFMDDDVREGFGSAIEARNAQGLIVNASVEGIRDIRIADAAFDDATGELELELAIDAELTRVVSNAEGEIVEGEKEKVFVQHDNWRFARIMGSDDPNWLLVETLG